MTETNQFTAEEGLFDDIQPDDIVETEETEQPAAVEEPAEDTPVEEETSKPFMRIRYNKEDKDLTEDEARTLAQKGMNYDKISNQYTTMNSRLQKMAEANGMDIETYLASLENAQRNLAVNQQMRSLRERYPDADDALLKELAEKTVEGTVNKREREAEQTAQKEENSRREEISRQVERFEAVYPGVDPTNLDQAVYDFMDKGATLLEAYTMVYKGREQKEDSIAKANEANKKRSFGNIGSAEKVKEDAFLSGFMNG